MDNFIEEQPKGLSENIKVGDFGGTPNENVNSNFTDGSSFGKFKSADALFDAYNNLQAEFTRRCQKIKSLEKQLEEKSFLANSLDSNLSTNLQNKNAINNESVNSSNKNNITNENNNVINSNDSNINNTNSFKNINITNDSLLKSNNITNHSLLKNNDSNIVDFKVNDNIINKSLNNSNKSLNNNNENLINSNENNITNIKINNENLKNDSNISADNTTINNLTNDSNVIEKNDIQSSIANNDSAINNFASINNDLKNNSSTTLNDNSEVAHDNKMYDTASNDLVPSYLKDDFKDNLAKFLSENKLAKQYAKEIGEEILNDKSLSLQNAYDRVLAKKYKAPSELANDDDFINNYILSNEKVLKNIIKSYKMNEKVLPAMISNNNGNIAKAYPSTVKTIKEAGDLAYKLFS